MRAVRRPDYFRRRRHFAFARILADKREQRSQIWSCREADFPNRFSSIAETVRRLVRGWVYEGRMPLTLPRSSMASGPSARIGSRRTSWTAAL